MDLDSFVVATPRPLPVILLLDTSGSMEGVKIAALNAALKEMAQDLGGSATPQGEIHVGMVVFNSTVEVAPPVPAKDLVVKDHVAGGNTAMGAAIEAARKLLEDRERIPGRAYTPTLVLVSDGQPTDAADSAIRALLGSERGKRAARLALAIGDDADVEMLKRFVANPEVPVFRAHETAKIRDFFRWVTFSVQVRTKSRDPDAAPLPPVAGFDADDLVY
jgi:uncharacterized protein YegL